jgi:hypothetical protein
MDRKQKLFFLQRFLRQLARLVVHHIQLKKKITLRTLPHSIRTNFIIKLDDHVVCFKSFDILVVIQFKP